MSNSHLWSEVSRLEAKLKVIECENLELISEINSAVASIKNAERDLSSYNQHIRDTLNNAEGTINNSTNTVLSAYELQGEIDKLYTKFKSIELANKKIRALNNKKYYDFNNYRVVRKLVQGMMDNLDLNMISDAVLYKSIERQYLLIPDFWLTSALISIMAWKNNDKILADKALESAFKLDKKNSSIFYMLFNLRMERKEAAIKWFMEYQKCDLKGDDEKTFLMLFSLISKTISDNVDEETSRMIKDFIHQLVLENAKKEGYSEEEIIKNIKEKMAGLVTTETYTFPLMEKCFKDYAACISLLNFASNNSNILEFILKIVNVPIAEKNTYLKDYMNELLEKPNLVEIETYNEIEYNELIIRLDGDVNAAKATFEQEHLRRESELNLISSIIQWIYDVNNENINGQMRLNMFTLIKSFQEKAADLYVSAYRELYREKHPVEILDYATEMDFASEISETAKAEQYYQEQQTKQLSAVKNISAYVMLGVGAACGAAAFYVHLALLAGLGIGVSLGIGLLINNKKKKKNIILDIQKQKSKVIEMIHNLFLEYGQFKQIYKEFNDVSDKIKEEFLKL